VKKSYVGVCVALFSMVMASPFLYGDVISDKLNQVFSVTMGGNDVVVSRIVSQRAGSTGDCDVLELAVKGWNRSVSCDQVYDTAKFCDGSAVEFKAPGKLVHSRGSSRHQVRRYDSDCDGKADRRVEVTRRGDSIVVDYDH
jgi:hypothetical protein